MCFGALFIYGNLSRLTIEDDIKTTTDIGWVIGLVIGVVLKIRFTVTDQSL